MKPGDGIPHGAVCLKPGHHEQVLPGDGSDTQHCCSPSPPCRLRQSAGMPVSNRKGLKTTKNPRQLCFSAALLMARWPPVNTKRSKGGYKGHVRRTQLPGLQREMQKYWQIWLKIACGFPGDTYHSHPCVNLAPAHESALQLRSAAPLRHFQHSMKICLLLLNLTAFIYQHMLDI